MHLVANADNLRIMDCDTICVGFEEPNSMLYATSAKIKDSSVPFVVVDEAILNLYLRTEICSFLSNNDAVLKRLKNKPNLANSITIDFHAFS